MTKTKTALGSIFPRGPMWFIKMAHKKGSSGVRIGEGVRERKASYEEAVKVRNEWIAELEAQPKGVEGVTLSFAIGRFFESKVKLGKSIRAAVARGEDPGKTAIARNFLSTADRLYGGFGANTLIENITTPMITAWRDKLLVSGRRVAVKGKAEGAKVELADQGLAPGSINAYLRVLSAVLHREHVEYQTLKVVPAIPMLDDEADDEEGEVVALDDGDVDSLLQASPLYLQRVILFSLNTGARKTEMMKLTWDKLEGLQPGANTRALVNFWKNTKRNRKRSVYLPDGLRDMLRAMRQEQLDGGYDGDRVFAFRHKYSPEWIEPAGMQETVWKAREAAELPNFTLHVCRHTFACRILQRGGTLALVSQLLGHSDLKTTQIYAKFAPENRADAAAFLDRDWRTSAAAAPASL